MKKYFFLILTAFAFTFSSCDKKVEESCDGENMKDDFNCNFDVMVTFCSDGENKSYYTYDGNKYECTGSAASTCDAALQQLSAAFIAKGCDGLSKSGKVDLVNIRLTEMAEKLLMEVRSESLNN